MSDSQSTPQGASTDSVPEHNPLLAGAIAAHEMFLAYVAAGFTENQALTIIARISRG